MPRSELVGILEGEPLRPVPIGVDCEYVWVPAEPAAYPLPEQGFGNSTFHDQACCTAFGFSYCSGSIHTIPQANRAELYQISPTAVKTCSIALSMPLHHFCYHRLCLLLWQKADHDWRCSNQICGEQNNLNRTRGSSNLVLLSFSSSATKYR